MSEEGRLQNFSVDQAAGAVVLVLGAVGGLLPVVWQSACHCKVTMCYLFQCERRPPSEKRITTLSGQVTARRDKKEPDEETLIPKRIPDTEPEPEPELIP